MRRFLIVALMVVLSVGLVACGASTDADTSNTSNVPTLEDGTVRVVLSWDEPVDMDLEIWDGDGMTAITTARAENDDITDGAEGSEYFDFTGEYEDGTYVMSVYFAGEESTEENVDVTLTVYQVDGATLTRTGSLAWEPGSDQWHAFSIDAVSGEITDIDEMVETVIE